MILDDTVVLMDKACQVASSLKLLPAVGRNAIWQKQFNKRCMQNQKELARAHAQKDKSWKKNIFINYLSRKNWILLEKVARVPRGKICLMLCLRDPKKQAGPKGIFSHTQMRNLLFIVSSPWHQVRYCSIWKCNHAKPSVSTVFLETIQGYYSSKRKFQQVSSIGESWPTLENH